MTRFAPLWRRPGRRRQWQPATRVTTAHPTPAPAPPPAPQAPGKVLRVVVHPVRRHPPCRNCHGPVAPPIAGTERDLCLTCRAMGVT